MGQILVLSGKIFSLGGVGVCRMQRHLAYTYMTYTGVSNFRKTVRFLAHPVYWDKLFECNFYLTMNLMCL